MTEPAIVHPESAPAKIVEFEFEVEDRSEGEPGLSGVEEVDIRLPIGPALKIGILLVALSFIIGYPLAGALALLFGAKYALYCYGISWGLFLPGVLIGGKEAHRRVGSRLLFWKGRRFKIWRVRLAPGRLSLWRRHKR
jgi:hypothetical protein